MFSKNLLLFILLAMMVKVMAQNDTSSIDILKPKVCLEPSENYFCFGGFLSIVDGLKNGTAGQCEFPVLTSKSLLNSYHVS